MPANTQRKFAQARRRHQVAELYLKGWSQPAIAQSTVSSIFPAGAFAWSLKAPPFAAPTATGIPFDASRYGIRFQASDGWRRACRDRHRRSG